VPAIRALSMRCFWRKGMRNVDDVAFTIFARRL